MKHNLLKSVLLLIVAACTINGWAYNDEAATFKWTIGNESEATIVSDASAGVKETKVKVGTSLSVSTSNSIPCNNGNTMVLYNPSSNKLGKVPAAMIEYSVKMKNGVTFTLTGLSYDAVKKGTDNAEYHWSYEIDDVSSDTLLIDKAHLIRDNNTQNTPPLHHEEAITATGGQVVKVRFFVSGFDAGKNFCLSNVQLTGVVNGEEQLRAFTNFKLDFRTNPYTVVEPATQPGNVIVANENYNGSQHGLQGGTITVDVDGPVKFTLGACGYGSAIGVAKNGVALSPIANNTACDNSGLEGGYNHYVTWLYNEEEAATLTFTVDGSYLPYFFAEACDFVPQVEVRYYDTDGKTLIGSEVVEGSSALDYKYGAGDVTVPSGQAFRGWFDGSGVNALKVAAGTPVKEDLSLYAKASEIEVAALGKIFSYDFKAQSFYPEDHEVLHFNGGSYNGSQHGWGFGNGKSLGIDVAGNALIFVGVCTYSHTGDTELRDADNNLVGVLTTEKEVTTDGALQTIQYTGPATTLTFHFTATDYIHSLKVYNIAAMPEKNELGYYVIAPNDGAGLILALEAMSAGDKIFLPDGLYDLGDECLTQISKNNVSIIGESMDGTVIKNTPDYHKEGISSTATLFVTANNTYLQDLTLWNNMDYFKALEVMQNKGRGVCLQDKGTQTVCKNVRMLSHQDTYYSNKIGGLKYFEDCEIHGTVDFICGDGSVYFKNNVLVGEQRNVSGGGANAITASNADASDKGFVLEGCRVLYAENLVGNKPVMSFGRSWNNSPKCVFLNTILDNTNGELIMTKSASAQKDKIDRWDLGAMNALPEKLGEFNSMDKNGNAVSPSSHNLTFVLGTAEKQMETILSASDAATYTMAYTLGSWATTAAADATQAECDLDNIDADGIYLVENDGQCEMLKGSNLNVNDLAATATVRKANARGGFGVKAGPGAPAAIEEVLDKAAEKDVHKLIHNGQLIIIRDGKAYNALGQLSNGR